MAPEKHLKNKCEPKRIYFDQLMNLNKRRMFFLFAITAVIPSIKKPQGVLLLVEKEKNADKLMELPNRKSANGTLSPMLGTSL
jgi:hypothetical protein